MTTPCPANAASPWTRIGSTCAPSLSPRRSMRALTEPSTTGLTISRCDGLNARERGDRAAGGGDVGGKPLVILDVASRQVVRMLAFEFSEQFLRHLAEDVD